MYANSWDPTWNVPLLLVLSMPSPHAHRCMHTCWSCTCTCSRLLPLIRLPARTHSVSHAQAWLHSSAWSRVHDPRDHQPTARRGYPASASDVPPDHCSQHHSHRSRVCNHGRWCGPVLMYMNCCWYLHLMSGALQLSLHTCPGLLLPAKTVFSIRCQCTSAGSMYEKQLCR